MNPAEPLRDPVRLWQRVREGQATAVLGRLPDPPPDLQLLRVSCEVAPAALRPLLEARRLTEAILGEARRKAPERVKTSRRRTLFGDTPERATEAVVVDLWNQLAGQAGARWVMVFDAVEQADEATLAALTQIVRRPAEWMRLPLLLVFHGEPRDAAAELLAAVRARGGDAVLLGDEPPRSEAQAIQWASLPPEVLRVLRAGALIGPGFETRIVAELLALEPLAVLERLQQAGDLGVPLEDRGEGRFSLPTSALTALSTSLMPSLAQAWHRRLGRLLGARACEEMAGRPPPPPAGRNPKPRRERIPTPGEALVAEILDLSAEVIDLVPETDDAAGEAQDMSPGTSEPTGVAEDMSEKSPESAGAAEDMSEKSPESAGAAEDMSAGTSEDASEAKGLAPDAPHPARLVRRKTVIAASVGAPEPEPQPEPVEPAPATSEAAGWGAPTQGAPTRLDEPLIDEARAAEHLRLAGEYDAAARHLCEAARKAADMGAPQAAAEHAGNALALLATLPASGPRRQLKVQALIELGRLQWQSAGYDLGFTLAQAQATLEAARAELDPDAPVDLAAELAQAIAGVCFDLGDARSLERALAELVSACQLLEGAGDEVGAACLLNDQAAVLIRMGDPVRALQLLRRSRQAFGAPVQDDPAALREFAETEHLFANLPLYAQLRPGREDEGYAMGLDHALAAERAYRELGEVRELGRVWETMGRLELRRGRLEPATQRLEAALEVQHQLGDLTGLAQTTEALSEARALCGRDAEAIALLRDSVVHNRDKGSPLGLQLDRRAFTALAGRLGERPEHAAGLQEVAILLAAGEREQGLSQPAAEPAPA